MKKLLLTLLAISSIAFSQTTVKYKAVYTDTLRSNSNASIVFKNNGYSAFTPQLTQTDTFALRKDTAWSASKAWANARFAYLDKANTFQFGQTIQNTGKSQHSLTLKNVDGSQFFDVDSSGVVTLSAVKSIKINYSNNNRFLTDLAAVGSSGNNIFLGSLSGSIALDTTGAFALIGSSTNGGSLNAGIGVYTQNKLTNGAFNTSVGYENMQVATTAYRNSTFGYLSGSSLTTGYQNSFYGLSSGLSATSGYNNSAFGLNALSKDTSGSENSVFGINSFLNNKNGSSNLGLGAYSGRYEMGSNTFYVSTRDRSTIAGDRSLSLMYGIFAATAAAQFLTVNAHFAVGDTTNSTAQFKIKNTTGANAADIMEWYNSRGTQLGIIDSVGRLFLGNYTSTTGTFSMKSSGARLNLSEGYRANSATPVWKYDTLGNTSIFGTYIGQNIFKQTNLLVLKDTLGNTRASIDSIGDLRYNFAHLACSADSINYTPTVNQWSYTRILSGMSIHDSVGLNLVGDSIKVQRAGDYMVQISVTVSGANQNDYWRIKLYKNGYPWPTPVGRFRWKTSNAGQTDTPEFFWYLKSLAANDYISFWITNETASRNPTFVDMKVYMEKKPE